MSQIFLTTTGATANVFIADLGEVTFVHPQSNLPLIEPEGEFQTEDLSVSQNLIDAITAGDIILTDAYGNTITSLADLRDTVTIQLATEETPGIAEIATVAEVNTGTDNSRFITPAGLASFTGLGENNTASNLGGGIGTFEGKVGVDLQFRSLVSQNTILGITLDAPNNEIDFTVDESNIVHDNLAGFVANEHIDWTVDAAPFDINDANIAASSVTQHQGDIDHDALTNFVANEHLDWTVDAGVDIADDNISQTAVTQHQAAIDHDALTNFVTNEHIDWTVDAGVDIADANISQSSVTQHQGAIDHDSLLNFNANEHVDHTSVVLTAGTGLVGGGDISASFTLDVVGVNSIVANANDIQLVNDTDSPGNNFYYGTNGLGAKGWYAIVDDGENNTASNLGGGIGVFDGKVGVDLQFRSLVSQNGILTISLDAVNDEVDFTINQGSIDHDALTNFVGNEHVDHSSVVLTAGTGLTGGGDITTSRTFNVVGQNSITALADAIQLVNDVASPGNLFFYGTNGSGVRNWLSQTSINHNTLTNYVAAQHVNHTSVVLTAGTGLTGGGDISASRTFNVVGQNSITALADAIQLVNDVGAPGNSFYYGTNASGTKGYNLLNLNSLSDVDTVTNPPIDGAILAYDSGTLNFEPTTTLLLNNTGCSIRTVDDTGLDWCNEQYGNSGSAFTILKKALGTIASPVALGVGDKIGGWGFIAFDNATSNPGYVGTEISSFSTDAQDAANGGTDLRMSVTPSGTKSPLTIFSTENNGDIVFNQYPDTRDDGATDKALYTTAGGGLRYGYVFPPEAVVITNGGSDNTINYNNATSTKVVFSGVAFTNSTDFTWNAGNNSWDASFTGAVKITINLLTISAGTRNHIMGRIVRDRGGGLTIFEVHSTYIRNSGGHDKDEIVGQAFFDVQPGDQFYVDTIRDGGNTTTTNLVHISNFNIRRFA